VALPQKELFKLESTRGDIVIPVDYNDPAAIDPGTDDLLWSQLAVDQLLGKHGATNFKHLEAAYDALPSQVNHEVTFNVAVGEQRSMGNTSNYGYDLSKKFVSSSGRILVVGASPSQWTLSDGSLTGLSITSHQVGSGDPWVQFAGTPFSGFDLKGHFAVLSTGQVVVIHDHTDDTLFLLAALSPDPTGATVDVKTPSTVFTNWLADGVTQAGLGEFLLDSGNLNPPLYKGEIYFQDVGFDLEGVSNWGVQIGSCGWLQQSRVFGGIGNSPNQVYGSSHSRLYVWSVSVSSPAGSSPFIAFGLGPSLYLSAVGGYYSYFRGPSAQGVSIQDSALNMYSCVMDDCGNAGQLGSMQLVQGFGNITDYGGNKLCEIRSVTGAESGLYLGRGSSLRIKGIRLLFKDCQAPCVAVADTRIDISESSNGFRDDGGNADVGIELVGPQAHIRLNEATDVFGTLGDVRLQGGDIVGYTEIEESPGGVIDVGLNRIEVA